MSIIQLVDKIKAMQNPTVAGLDPNLSYIPAYIKEKVYAEYGKTFEGAAEAIWQFNKGLIEALCDVVPAVKPQSAFYEMYGIPGLVTLDKTIAYAQEKGMYVILDVKRNDIGTTAAAYSAAYIGETELDGEKGRAVTADGLTINPYLGTDGIQPFVQDANTYGKTIFALVKTSNPSSGELQDLMLQTGEPVYEAVAKLLNQLANQCLSENGYSALGCVVGATYPEQAERLRQMLPHSYFLVPGYGAQGGTADTAAKSFNKDGLGAIVNSSRKIMCAYQNGYQPEQFGEAARAEALRMKADLNRAIDKMISEGGPAHV